MAYMFFFTVRRHKVFTLLIVLNTFLRGSINLVFFVFGVNLFTLL
jgi:hypothetical protein